MPPVAPDQGPDAQRRTTQEFPWREALVQTLLPMIVIALPLLALGLWLFTLDRLVRLALVATIMGFFLLAALELVRPFLGTQGRAWLLVGSFLVPALLGFSLLGFLAGSSLLTCAALLLARVLLGRRVYLGLIGVLIVSTSIIGWVRVNRHFPWDSAELDAAVHDPSAWVRTAIFAMFTIFFISLLVTFVLDRIEATTRDNIRLYREARRALRQRDEFLSIASHELRTPVAALRLATEGLVSGRLSATPTNLQRSLAIVQRNVGRMSNLVGQLLDLSRSETGRLDLTLEEVELSTLVREVVELFSAPPSASPITLDVAPTLCGLWDRSRLEQVVVNLLSNAQKFGAGKPIEISLGRVEGCAILVVRDHGVGIDPELVPHIFDRFVRGSSPRAHGGLGLGLFIVRSIIEAMGGTITVETFVDEGAAFTVTLPIRLPDGGGSR